MTLHRDLIERESAARQREQYHRRQFESALANLKALAAQPQGGRLQAAGERLASCELSELQAAVLDFADAILDRNAAGDDLQCLANSAVRELRSLAHHVNRQADALRDASIMAELLTAKELSR